MLGDAGRSIPSSLFSMADMCYDSKENTKGILMVDCPSPVVIRPKLAYYVMQRLFSTVPNNITAAPSVSADLHVHSDVNAGGASDDGDTQAFAFRDATGRMLYAFWLSGAKPTNGSDTITVNATLTVENPVKEPALIDLLSGAVYGGMAGGTSFTVPAIDSAMLLAERSMVPM